MVTLKKYVSQTTAESVCVLPNAKCRVYFHVSVMVCLLACRFMENANVSACIVCNAGRTHGSVCSVGQAYACASLGGIQNDVSVKLIYST